VEGGDTLAELHIRFEDRELTVSEPRELVIGRDPSCDVYVADERVSRRHAVVRFGDDGWELEDAGSTNGTFHGADRVTRLAIRGPIELRLGNVTDGVEVEIVPPVDLRGTVVVRPQDVESARQARRAGPRGPGSNLGRMSAINRLVHEIDITSDQPRPDDQPE
jgi:hypothetical protein